MKKGCGCLLILLIMVVAAITSVFESAVKPPKVATHDRRLSASVAVGDKRVSITNMDVTEWSNIRATLDVLGDGKIPCQMEIPKLAPSATVFIPIREFHIKNVACEVILPYTSTPKLQANFPDGTVGTWAGAFIDASGFISHGIDAKAAPGSPLAQYRVRWVVRRTANGGEIRNVGTLQCLTVCVNTSTSRWLLGPLAPGETAQLPGDPGPRVAVACRLPTSKEALSVVATR